MYFLIKNGIIGHDVNFTSVRWTVFNALIVDGRFEHAYTDKYKAGE